MQEPEFMADAALRERAQAPVEEAIRGHFHGMGTVVDDATLRRDASIVLRGLTHAALARIASGGMSGTELIQALIPKPAQLGTLPAFNWSAITPAEIARLRAAGLLSDHHLRQALGLRGGEADGLESEGRGGGRSGYGTMDTRWDASAPYKLTAANWSQSPFAGISGLDIATTKGLLADGFTVPEIVKAGGMVKELRVNTKEQIASVARLNKEAPGFMPQMLDYAGKLESHRKTEGAIAKDEVRLAEMEKQGQGGSEAAAALRANIERQKQELEKARQENEAKMNKAIEALPDNLKPEARALRDATKAAEAKDAGATAEQQRVAAERNLAVAKKSEANAEVAAEQDDRNAFLSAAPEVKNAPAQINQAQAGTPTPTRPDPAKTPAQRTAQIPQSKPP